MRFSTVAIFAIGAAASAIPESYGKNETVKYTTEVVTKLTTYCPEPTKLTHAGKTYTITEATTLTITDCPCTISKPVTSWKATSTPWKYESDWKSSSKVESSYKHEYPTSSYKHEEPKKTTTWEAPKSTPKANATTSAPVKFTGAANAFNAAGAGVVGVAALFAAVL